jgi:hypothetical protein
MLSLEVSDDYNDYLFKLAPLGFNDALLYLIEACFYSIASWCLVADGLLTLLLEYGVLKEDTVVKLLL